VLQLNIVSAGLWQVVGLHAEGIGRPVLLRVRPPLQASVLRPEARLHGGLHEDQPAHAPRRVGGRPRHWQGAFVLLRHGRVRACAGSFSGSIRNFRRCRAEDFFPSCFRHATRQVF